MVNVIKAILAHILLNYDIKMANGGGRPEYGLGGPLCLIPRPRYCLGSELENFFGTLRTASYNNRWHSILLCLIFNKVVHIKPNTIMFLTFCTILAWNSSSAHSASAPSVGHYSGTSLKRAWVETMVSGRASRFLCHSSSLQGQHINPGVGNSSPVVN